MGQEHEQVSEGEVNMVNGLTPQCPYCGCRVNVLCQLSLPPKYIVSCPECIRKTEPKYTYLEAIQEWNRLKEKKDREG